MILTHISIFALSINYCIYENKSFYIGTIKHDWNIGIYSAIFNVLHRFEHKAIHNNNVF